MSLLYTTFSGTYVRTVRTGSYAHDFKSRKSEVGIEDPPRLSYVPGFEIVASAESRKRVHEEEKNKTKQKTKKIGRKLGRGRALPLSFFLPRQLSACLSLWPLPHSFMSSPLSLLSESLKQVRVVSICKRCIMHACKLHRTARIRNAMKV